MLANIRRETRIAALFPHEFPPFPPSPYPPYPRERAHVRAHVTTYMLACIRYVYIRAWRERREDSIPPGSYTRKKNGRRRERACASQKENREKRGDRERGRERVIYREYEVEEEGRENTTRRGPRVEEGGHTRTLVTSPSWSSQWALGRPDRRGM